MLTLHLDRSRSHPGFVLPKGNYTVTLPFKDNSGQWSNEIVSWVDVRDGTPLAYTLQA